jgi:hypothetical protein
MKVRRIEYLLQHFSMIMDDDELIDNNPVLISLLVPFPDKEIMTDGRNWLPLHFALALGDNIKEDDARLLYSRNPLSMQAYHLVRSKQGVGFLPGYFLCMQIKPNLFLVRFLSLRDSKTFTMRVCGGRAYLGGMNSLQLAAEHSESVDLIMNLMQIDHMMLKEGVQNHSNTLEGSVSAFGFLCRRSHFISFNEMYECLLAADNSIGVVDDGLVSCFRLYGRSNGAGSQVVFTQVESLLKANP